MLYVRAYMRSHTWEECASRGLFAFYSRRVQIDLPRPSAVSRARNHSPDSKSLPRENSVSRECHFELACTAGMPVPLAGTGRRRAPFENKHKKACFKISNNALLRHRGQVRAHVFHEKQAVLRDARLEPGLGDIGYCAHVFVALVVNVYLGPPSARAIEHPSRSVGCKQLLRRVRCSVAQQRLSACTVPCESSSRGAHPRIWHFMTSVKRWGTALSTRLYERR